MKLKAIVKAVVTVIEIGATLWAAGVFIGAGLRDGAKISDTRDQWSYDILKSRKIKGLRKKLDKLNKKEQLTEEDKKAQIDILAEIFSWQSINTRELSCLGTSIPRSFDINYKKEEKA